MPNDARGRLDHAIDRAVRGMMQVDPPPGLRYRVAGRLGSAARRRWTLAAAAGAAALVVVMLAVGWFRAGTSKTPVQPTVAVASSPSATPADSAPAVRAPAAVPAPAAVQSPHAAATIDPPLRAPRPAGSAPRGEAIFAGLRDRVSAASVRAASGEAVEAADERAAEPSDELFLLPPIAITPISIAPIVVAPVTVPPITERK